jgi:nucleotide-binding universal stress UspA family protein
MADNKPEAEIVVGVSGSLASLEALRYAVAQARARGITLNVVRAGYPSGGDTRARRAALPPVWIDDWRQSQARELEAALHDALGAVPADVTVEQHVVLGRPGEVLAYITEPQDTLILGAMNASGGRLKKWLRVHLRHSVAAYCARRCRSPLVIVPMPEMAYEALGRRRLIRQVNIALKAIKPVK